MVHSQKIIFFLAFVCSCGTKVDVGSNEDVGRRQAQEDPYFDADANAGDQTGDKTGGGGALGTCFGTTTKPSAAVEKVCAGSLYLAEKFPAAHDMLCVQKRLHNLDTEQCNWRAGGGDKKDYLRALERTELNDGTTKQFSFLGAYGLMTQGAIEDVFRLYKDYYHDPDFEDRFVTLENGTLENVEIFDDRTTYHASLASSAAMVRFHGEWRAEKLSDDLIVVTDWSTGGYVTLQNHRAFRILIKVDAQTTREILVDEKLVDDGGSHLVAYKTVLDILEQRMEMTYVNPSL